MRSKPSNWYDMTYDEQQRWKREERERQDMEYELARAQQDVDAARCRASREAAAQREELRITRADLDTAAYDLECVRRARDQANAFIRARGLWEEFVSWTPPARAADDDE
jgi:hypothetical protein